MKWFISREEKLQECESEISQQKETVRRLETEMTELYTKIEAGEGSNTAIQQLQLEKVRLLTPIPICRYLDVGLSNAVSYSTDELARKGLGAAETRGAAGV